MTAGEFLQDAATIVRDRRRSYGDPTDYSSASPRAGRR